MRNDNFRSEPTQPTQPTQPTGICCGAQDYRVDIYLRQTWVDPRLTFPRLDDHEHLVVSSKGIDNIWTPDVFFPNEKSAAFHKVTVPNELMRIYHNGTVQYSVRYCLCTESVQSSV